MLDISNLMERRKVGERSRLLFDEIDFQIMEFLVRHSEKIGVLELGEKLGNLKHANLKKHLDRLEKAKLIKKTPVPKSRKLLISIDEKTYPKEVRQKLLEILNSL